MHKIRLANGKTFEAAGSDSIINEALAAGVVLEYSCSNGRCAACKAPVVDGSTVQLSPEIGLNQEECARGEVLLCCRKASSDLVLGISDLGGRIPPARRVLPSRIQTLKQVSGDVVEVFLRVPPNSKLNFLPGQYVNISSRGGVGRSYSLASSQRDDGLLQLLIRNVPGGAMSGYWFGEAKVNDLLQISGPLGSFYLRDAQASSIVFLATGTGIAPVKAMLEELAARSDESRGEDVYVFWGGRTTDDLFLDISQIDPRVRYVPVLSRADASWNGHRGYVQDAVKTTGIDLSNSVVYACGSPAMISSSRERLSAEGLKPHNFHSDAFVASSP